MNAADYDGAREVIQAVVDAASRNPQTGAYLGCDHYRMRTAVHKCEDWLATHQVIAVTAPAEQSITINQ